MDFYFSDANILKDSFLLKHVRRNKEGYVNLKLITSFKKMKTLTRDYRIVAFSLRRHSKILVVNEDGNKAKRKEPLPDYDETKTSRTVIAFNLAADPPPTMASVSSLFKDCGDIVMLQIHKPGKSNIPSDVKKHFMKFTLDGSAVPLCAVIEFEKHEQAQKAISKSAEDEDITTGLRVIMLTTKSKNTLGDDSDQSDSEFKQKKRNKKKTLRSQALEKDREGLSSGSEGDFLMPRPRSRNSSFGSDKSYNGKGHSPNRSMLSPTHADKSWNGSPNGSPASGQRRRSIPLPQSPLAESSKSSPKASPKPSPKTSPRASPEMRRRANSGGVTSSPESGSNSPWVQRRMQASREMSPLAKGANGRKVEALIRNPRGPDPGKGFYSGKGRGKPLMSVEC